MKKITNGQNKHSPEGVKDVVKRKVAHNAAKNNNTTPKESLPDTEFAAQFLEEDKLRGANRNSKNGRQGK